MSLKYYNLTIKAGCKGIENSKCATFALVFAFATHLHLKGKRVHSTFNVVLLTFSLKGLLCEGSEESPILHLRLVEPYETYEEDEEKLKQVVANVSSFCFYHQISKVYTVYEVIYIEHKGANWPCF